VSFSFPSVLLSLPPTFSFFAETPERERESEREHWNFLPCSPVLVSPSFALCPSPKTEQASRETEAFERRMGRVTKAGAAAGSNRRQHSTQQSHGHQQLSLGQPVPSLFPDDIAALLRKASAGKSSRMNGGGGTEREEGERARERERALEGSKNNRLLSFCLFFLLNALVHQRAPRKRKQARSTSPRPWRPTLRSSAPRSRPWAGRRRCSRQRRRRKQEEEQERGEELRPQQQQQQTTTAPLVLLAGSPPRCPPGSPPWTPWTWRRWATCCAPSTRGRTLSGSRKKRQRRRKLLRRRRRREEEEGLELSPLAPRLR